MEKITGVIEDIESRTGEKNGKPWTKYSFKVNGRFISSFDKQVGQKMEKGKCYDFEVERKGDYLNLAQNTTPQEVTTITSNQEMVIGPTPVTYQDSKDQSIRRQVALKCAVELTHHIMAHSNIKYAGESKVLRIATVFDAWLNGKDDFVDPGPLEYEEEVGDAVVHGPEHAFPADQRPRMPRKGEDAPEPHEDASREKTEVTRQKIRNALRKRWPEDTEGKNTSPFCQQWGADTVDGIPVGNLQEALGKITLKGGQECD